MINLRPSSGHSGRCVEAIAQRDRAEARARATQLHNASLQERVDRLERISVKGVKAEVQGARELARQISRQAKLTGGLVALVVSIVLCIVSVGGLLNRKPERLAA
jgi:hypothetical protein